MTATQKNGEVGCPDPDPYLSSLVFVDQLPSDAWAEGLAMRPNGDALASRVDRPELLAIELASSQLSADDEFAVHRPRTIHTFDNANSVFDVCALKPREPADMQHHNDEEYAVISGFADFANVDGSAFHSFALWRVSLAPGTAAAAGDDGSARAAKLADLTDAVIPVGLETVSASVVLIADAGKSCIWKVDLAAGGRVSVFLEDPSMRPHEGDAFGVNRIKVRAGYIWYTNTGTGTLSRAPVAIDQGSGDIQVTGPVQPVAEGLSNAADGLVMFDDASAAYVVSYALGILWRIDIDPVSGEGTTHVLRDDLLSPTAMQLVYPKDEGGKGKGKPALHILCCGAIQEAWLYTDKGAWFDMAKVTDKLRITVTVTTEVTYEYI